MPQYICCFSWVLNPEPLVSSSTHLTNSPISCTKKVAKEDRSLQAGLEPSVHARSDKHDVCRCTAKSAVVFSDSYVAAGSLRRVVNLMRRSFPRLIMESMRPGQK